jgi:hypothetical protein
MRGIRIAGLVAAMASLFSGSVAASPAAGAKFGTQIQVNTAGGVQRAPALAANAAGGSVVAWQNGAVSPNTIVARRYSAVGLPFSAELEVANGFDPDVAMNATDGFVVVYNNASGLRARVYQENGQPLGTTAITVDPSASAATPVPTVGMDANGRWVTAYFRDIGGVKSVVARRFSFDGALLDDIIVNNNGQNCLVPVVAMASNGNFLVACITSQLGTRVVKAQLYDNQGDPIGLVFEPSGQNNLAMSNLRAAMDASGGSLVAWQLDANRIFARYFDPSGAGLGDEFEVANVASPGLQLGDVGLSAEGEGVITWDNRGGGTGQAGATNVFARRYNKTRVARDATAFQVNTGNPQPHQFRPVVGVDADGDFTIVWQDGDGASESDIRGQRFVGPEAVDLSLVIADSSDPVAGGAALAYTFTLSNGHPDVTPIAGASPGIAAVNGSIGASHNIVLVASMPDGIGSVTQDPSDGWRTCQYDAGEDNLLCVFDSILDPGETTALVVRTTAPNAGTSTQLSATAGQYQFDPNSANDSDTETTALTGTLPTVQFAAAASSADESGQTVNVTVTLSSAAAEVVTVSFAPDAASTATASDYSLSASPLTFAIGETSKTIAVTVVNDTAVEGAETLVLKLSSPSSNAALGSATTHTLTINANDGGSTVPTVQFSQAAQSRGESAGTVEVTIELSAASQTDVIVNYSVAGTATSGTDFTATPPSAVTIEAGETTATISVAITNDTTVEPNETVVLTLATPTGATLGTQTTHTLTIEDNDTSSSPTAQFAIASQSVGENAGQVQVVVQLSAPAAQEVTIPYTVGGTAIPDTDYSVAPAGSVQIPANASQGVITITIVNDQAAEQSESVILTLGTPTGGTLGTTTTHTLTIIDNDTAGGASTVKIVGESGGELTFKTNQGTFTGVSRSAKPPVSPAGLEYPEGFFDFEIDNVPAGGFVTLEVTVPEGTGITDWIDCPEDSCYRYPEGNPPVAGEAGFVGDTITIVLQDNAAGDDDPRPGIIGSKVAPARPKDDDGGSLSWLFLAPLMGIALLRRRFT